MTSIRYIGMDVDKEGINLAVFEDNQTGPVLEKRILNNPKKIADEMDRLKAGDHVLNVCYEAGPCGFDLKRFMDQIQVHCIVVAPGLVPKRSSDRIKTNRRDALILGRMLRSGEIDAIHVPTPETESVRDLVRCREDLKEDLLRRKHRLSKFLLRHGRIYPGTSWTLKHCQWLGSLTWDLPALTETFEQYRQGVGEANERLYRCDERLCDYAKMPRWEGPVEQLRCFRGIDTLSALGILSEIEDFRRFRDARDFMAYVGLAVCEHSTGSTRRQGGITKTGNRHIRTLLVEAAWSYRHKPLVTARLRKRRQGKSEWMIRFADRAMHRLNKKFYRLVNRGKSSTIAVVAVARELAGFIWASQALQEKAL
jgi:transposase